jgi:hypothetical protein
VTYLRLKYGVGHANAVQRPVKKEHNRKTLQPYLFRERRLIKLLFRRLKEKVKRRDGLFKLLSWR